MDKNIFAETKQRIARYVTEHRLHDAFSHLRSLAEGMGERTLADEAATVEEGYRYMLEYAARGAEDPGRKEMVRRFGVRVLEIADMLERANRKADSPTYYFNVLRYEEMQKNDSIASLLAEYMKLNGEVSLFNLVVSGTHSEKARLTLVRKEALERRLFNRLWVTHPLSASDAEAVASAVMSDDVPSYFRELTVAALILGGLEYFDERRVDILLDAYTSPDTRVSSAAFIGLCLLLYKGRRRGLSASLVNKLDAARERNGWGDDMRAAYMELAKTIDTDRISRKITEEVVPEMLKLRPEIDRKISGGIEGIDPSEFEENPEWQEMLDRSGLSEKLKEMSEIQEEGGDVMLGTFAHLKTFPFFNEPSNWFLPFHTDYSEFTGADSAAMQPVADLIASAPFLCDSDKYSFMFSLRMVPAAQRELMLSQLKAHGDQIAELRAASLIVGDVDRKNIMNKQVQNFYRFFKLFRRKGEFPNPFVSGVNPVEVPLLRKDVLTLEILPLVGEFYFTHGYYAQALQIFEAMGEVSSPDAQLHQKMGYAFQKGGETEKAIEHYLKAEMLDGGSDWTLRRLSRCLMMAHRVEEALPRLRVLAERHPENAGIALNIGRCLVETGNYDEAVKAYYKAEYLDEKSGKALRPLAWCLFLTGDTARSRKYYEKVLAVGEPIASDYLNMGHLALAERRFSEALNFYSLNISARSDGHADGSARRDAVDAFIADMRADTPYLRMAGVDVDLLPLLIDSVLYGM